MMSDEKNADGWITDRLPYEESESYWVTFRDGMIGRNSAEFIRETMGSRVIAWKEFETPDPYVPPEPDASLASSIDVAERYINDEDISLDFHSQVAPAIRSLIAAVKERDEDDTPDPGEGFELCSPEESSHTWNGKGWVPQGYASVWAPGPPKYHRRRIFMTEQPSDELVESGRFCWSFCHRQGWRTLRADVVKHYWCGDDNEIAWYHKLPGEDKPPQMLLDWEAEYRKGQTDTPSESEPPTLEDVPDGNLCVVKTGVANCRMYGAEARMKWKPHWTWGFISSEQDDSTPSESERREWWRVLNKDEDVLSGDRATGNNGKSWQTLGTLGENVNPKQFTAVLYARRVDPTPATIAEVIADLRWLATTGEEATPETCERLARKLEGKR